MTLLSFGSTKLTAHPEDVDGVSSQNVRKHSHFDARENFTEF
jgi:hypothetical protein